MAHRVIRCGAFNSAAIEGEADMAGRADQADVDAKTQLGHLAAQFAVAHNSFA
jgi:hypothetical protein